MGYPVMLHIANQHVVVIGGGRVAERKIKGLLEAEAKITVVAPSATGGIQQLAAAGALVWRRKTFSPDDIKEAWMVIAATNNREVNEAVAAAAEPYQLINIADDPERSNFHVPAVVRRGRLTIAVSTGGASPTVAQQIRRQLAEQYDEDCGRYIEFLYECRQFILRNVSDERIRKKLFKAIAQESFRKKGNWEEEFHRLLEMTL
ncbi:Precorrin-2 dehydrogenase [Anoxybacillus sp. P3H1B]|jgi:precorrin-2 dehydrogenase / sirohydrochlorin ferrochelatase|uniref:NAD(P)-binding protein n=1 Tax=Anoxybacillaceae TaxID=3120669 RepID=UPI000791DB8F|nr:NAD(P)-binding protein [Anoxybacillus sp. P3H1B]KXG10890.1 Precorrin-2 dehydrogenase [Anoxybacillus sp. P3H1B]